jgi:hypothetical protein
LPFQVLVVAVHHLFLFLREVNLLLLGKYLLVFILDAPQFFLSFVVDSFEFVFIILINYFLYLFYVFWLEFTIRFTMGSCHDWHLFRGPLPKRLLSRGTVSG